MSQPKKRSRKGYVAPAMERRAIKMRKQEGLSFREIARRTGLARNTVARICGKADRSVSVDALVKESGLHADWLASIQDMLRATKCPDCDIDFLILSSMSEARCPQCRRVFRLASSQ